MADAAADCANGGLWALMATARQSAINDFIADIQAAIGKNYKSAAKNFVGSIGKRKFDTTDTYTPSTTYLGWKVYPKPMKDGIWKIEKVGLCVNTTQTINFSIFSSLSATALHTFSIACVANVLTMSATLNYELPMYDGDEIEYYVVYEPAGVKPLGCMFYQCCGFHPNYSNWGREHQADRMWYNHLKVGCLQADDLDGMMRATPTTSNSYGMVIECRITCDSKNVICDNLDYLGSPTAYLIAGTIVHRAAFHLLHAILNSQNINRAVMMDRERMQLNANAAAAEYTDRIAFLASDQGMDISQNGCYECDPIMFTASIRT